MINDGSNTQANPDNMAQEWHDFLKRNNLTCQKSCCADIRLHVMDKNAQAFRGMTQAERDAVWQQMNTYFEAEKAGRSFRWDDDSNQWVIQP